MEKVVLLGLTGGIGSGKSYVGHLLERRGYPRYDCDSQAKRLTQESPHLKQALTALLGPQAYLADGVYNRPFVASQVFHHPHLLAQIEALVHPVVNQDFCRWAQVQAPMAEHCVVMFETALLPRLRDFEPLDFIVTVTAPEDLRVARAIARDGSSRQMVLARMACQPTQEEFEQIANFVIVNDGQHPLEPQLNTLASQLRKVSIDKLNLEHGCAR